jgi:hypothetical protein
MNPENASMLGYILLLVGIALAFIGYAVYLNIRSEKPSEIVEDEVSEGKDVEEDLSDIDSGESHADLSNADEEPIIDLNSDEVVDRSSDFLQSKLDDQPIDAEKSASSFDAIPDDPELIPAATLFREAVTGRIVVKVGDRQYESVDSLKNSKDWPRVQSLSADLSDWILDKPKPSTTQDQAGIVKMTSSVEGQSSDPDSMVAQINQIIEKKIKSMDEERREIELVEGLLGALEVRIGTEKFPIDEVPYENVRDLIQESVSQWENSQ